MKMYTVELWRRADMKLECEAKREVMYIIIRAANIEILNRHRFGTFPA